MIVITHTLWQRNPQCGHLDHCRVDSTSTSRRSTESTSTPLTRTPDKCKRTDYNIRHRGLLAPANWYFTDFSEASPPFQGFHPTQPTFPRRASILDYKPPPEIVVTVSPPQRNAEPSVMKPRRMREEPNVVEIAPEPSVN